MRSTVERVAALFAMVFAGSLTNAAPSPAQQPFAHHLRPGIGNFSMGQYDAALHEFKQAEVETPRDPMVHYYLGSTEAKLDQIEAAMAQFREAIALSPDGSQVRQYAQAALAVCDSRHSTSAHHSKLLFDTGPPPAHKGDKPGSVREKETQQQIAQAEGRAEAIEAQAEAQARQMQTATIKIGNLTVRRFTDEDIKEVRLEAQDKADLIRRQYRQRAKASQ